MKLLKLLLIAGMALSLNAAKLTGPDENGRLYNTAYFDITVDGQSPILDVISYSKRVGTFDWSKLDKQIKSIKTHMKFKIATRVQIPSEFKTNSVYITVGDIYGFRVDGSNFNPRDDKQFSNDAIFELLVTANDSKFIGSSSILTPVKKDEFGNSYVELNLMFNVIVGSSSYTATYPQYKKNIASKLAEIKIKVAPKSRTFQSKWVEPKIYVMDE